MGIGRIVKNLLPSVLAAGVAIPLLFPLPAAAQADKTVPGGKPSIEILAPVAGAVVPAGKVLVIGRVKGAMPPAVEVDVNGKSHHKAAMAGGGFMASVYLTRGKNVLTVHADGATVDRTVLGSDAVNYKYHPEVEKCGGCHADTAKGYVVSGRKDTVCYQCHDRKDGKKIVHGPLGGGDCTTCHDPHGALNPALTVATAEGLCVRCHNQPHSEKHMRESKAVGCVTCHEPHSSGKEFLQK
jgi:predicted CXXCH cytochrome family protein